MKNKYLSASILICSLLLFGCICLPLSPEETSILDGTSGPTKQAYSMIQSKNYWSATAPFVISSWSYSGKSVRVVIQNMDMQKITLSEIASDDFTLYSGNFTISAGGSAAIDFPTALPCGSPGDEFLFQGISLTYSKGSISGLQQVGSVPIVGKCS